MSRADEQDASLRRDAAPDHAEPASPAGTDASLPDGAVGGAPQSDGLSGKLADGRESLTNAVVGREPDVTDVTGLRPDGSVADVSSLDAPVFPVPLAAGHGPSDTEPERSSDAEAPEGSAAPSYTFEPASHGDLPSLDASDICAAAPLDAPVPCAPVSFPVPPPFPEVLRPRVLLGNLIAREGVSPAGQASPPHAAGQEAMPAGEPASCSDAAAHAPENSTTELADTADQVGDTASDAPTASRPGDAGIARPSGTPAVRGGRAWLAAALTVLAVGLLAAAIVLPGPWQVFAACAVGVAAVAGLLAGRAALAGGLSAAAYRTVQLVLLVVTLACVVMQLSAYLEVA
ncbi:MAG: hypothetical protein KHY83_02885 [Coriobacteriia bacterium]|nr:hypothetical protein [Coriobacteriia bacterium]MBS5477594.1 hypothetical protein [Coriobacteriia bacterium]